MEKILERIKRNATLFSSVNNCGKEVTPILQTAITNFPEYTDHSIVHSKRVLEYATYLLDTELEKLNDDEVYVLIMAGYLHDIGMCPTKAMRIEINENLKVKNGEETFEDYLRTIH